MAADLADSRSPLWRRAEAATPWTEEHSEPAEASIDAAAAPAAQTERPEQRQLAPQRESRLLGTGGDLRRDEAPGDSVQASQALWREQPQTEDGVPDLERPARQLHPLPRGLVELYGLLAVLFVLVPEWMASGALFGFREGRQGSELPAPSAAWKCLPELRLASLNLAELRQLAAGQGLIGYSRQNRLELTARLLRRLKTRS